MHNDEIDETNDSDESIDPRLRAAEERLQITNQVLSAAEGEVRRRLGTLTPEETDEAVIVLGGLRHDYRVAERKLIETKRELGL